MKIKSYKTGIVHDIPGAQWEKMVGRGDGYKYEILSKKVPEIMPVPKDAEGADYAALLAKANKALKAKNFNGAKKLFGQVKAIKATPYVISKLDQIENALMRKSHQID